MFCLIFKWEESYFKAESEAAVIVYMTGENCRGKKTINYNKRMPYS